MKKTFIPFVLLIIVIGGCSAMNDSNQSEKNNSINANNEEENEKYDPNHYAPIQEYTGEGYALEGACEETGEIANEHREEVEKAVEDFFENEYKTEIKVHNIVSAKDGVSVFVESIGEPHFYSFAIVPVDIKNKEVKTDQVWSQEGQVESGIKGGLYAMAFEEEFKRLDTFLKELEDNYPIIGTRIKAIQNVMGTGYSTPHYFLAPSGNAFRKLYDEYKKNPSITKDEIKETLKDNNFKPKNLNIAIEFYMEDVNSEPDKQIYNEIYNDIKELDDVPKGEYYIVLNDNFIDRTLGIGQKRNSIDETLKDGLIKH